MKLIAYLRRHKLTASDFAARLGKPPSTITRIINGDNEPRMDLLRAIHAETKGKVAPNDFLEKVEGRNS